MYKILILKTFNKKLKNNQKDIEYLKRRGVDVSIEEQVVSFENKTFAVGNAKFNNAGVLDIPYEKLRLMVPENKYNAVIVYHDYTLTKPSVSIAFPNPLYQNTDYIQINTDKKGRLAHEVGHAAKYKLERRGIIVQDVLDEYILDGDLNDEDASSINKHYSYIQPYWNTICDLTPFKDIGCKPGYTYSTTTGLLCPTVPLQAPTSPVESTLPLVTITRNKSTKKETTGVLKTIKGGAIFMCNTLELPWLENKSNISCIPVGKYLVTFSFSPRKLKYTYRVQNVPGRSGILFHSANYFSDLLGCIGLGSGTKDINNDGEIDIINSRATVSAFEGFMGKKSFQLEIK